MKEDFSISERKILRRLTTPRKIQDYLNKLPFNFEKKGETLMSPRRVLREKRAHCLEGALLAAAAFALQGEKPLLFDLRAADHDADHVVALFRKFNRWGAVSKTNHGVLRYREPVYRSIDELAMSYFHEYFLKNGKKTLRSYSSKPFDLSNVRRTDWMTAEENLWEISAALDRAAHTNIATSKQIRNFRKADKIEVTMGEHTEW